VPFRAPERGLWERDKRELLGRLLPVAVGTADVMAVAEALMDEMRHRKILLLAPP